jgi:hypothetical protein
MKLSGYRVFFFCILVLYLLACPVFGDEMVPTNTHVYFEKDGQPFNESVQYTVSCYGYRCDWSTCSPPARTENRSKITPEIIFSYSATCPGYGCTIYEPFYLNYRHIDQCDLEGTTKEGNFTLKNFSTTPLPNCTDLHQFDIGKGYGNYYQVTPEFTRCENASYEAGDLCEQYLSKCNPVNDLDCGSWVVNGSYVKDTPESRACREEADKKRNACDVYLAKVDPSTMVMWKDARTGQEEPVMRTCEQRFTIPSDNRSVSAFVPPDRIAHIQMHRVDELIWCRIVQMFGGRCE